MKERRGRRDKNGFANDPESKKSYTYWPGAFNLSQVTI